MDSALAAGDRRSVSTESRWRNAEGTGRHSETFSIVSTSACNHELSEWQEAFVVNDQTIQESIHSGSERIRYTAMPIVQKPLSAISRIEKGKFALTSFYCVTALHPMGAISRRDCMENLMLIPL